MNERPDDRTVFYLPNYGVPRVQSLGRYHYKEVRPGLEGHVHQNVVEICYCMKGRQQYKIGDRLVELNGNDIFIVPPNTPHGTDGFPEDKGELFWIQISTVEAQDRLCNLSREQSEFLIDSLLKNTARSFKGAFQVRLILEKLMTHLKNHDHIMSKIMIDQLIVQLVLETVLLAGGTQQTAPSLKLGVLDEFIEQNLYRIIYVDELAELATMSTGYFKAWFKRQTGMPPKEYVNRLRIERAKFDLLKGNSVTKVAFDLGFGSSQYFATVFKKFTGYSPSSYVRVQSIASATS